MKWSEAMKVPVRSGEAGGAPALRGSDTKAWAR